MTRSSNQELLEPYEEPKRVLYSLRKIFKTTSLASSSSPEFELFSDHENQFEEEDVKITRKPNIEEYMTKPREDYGSDNEDANEHTEKVLEIVDLFNIPEEVILFYKGLNVPTRQILDSKGAIPTMNVANAKKAIQDMADNSQKWHNGTSTRTRSTETSDGLAAIQAQLNNIRREIKKVNEKVYAAQVGCELCNGPHYTKDCPLKEEENTLEEAYYTQFRVPFSQGGRYRAAALEFYQRDNGCCYQKSRILNQSFRDSNRANEQGTSIKGSLPGSTETNPRDHVKLISTTVEAETSLIRRIGLTRYDVSSPQNRIQFFMPNQSIIPFPSRLIDDSYEERGELEELIYPKESATNLKRFLKEKSRGDEIEASMNVQNSTILEDALPLKEKDPGSFTIPCNINNVCFEKALADLRASVSAMPYSTFTNLGLGELAPTKLIVELADRTVKRPKGIAENVLVGIDNLSFP
ncbi:putative reverse transcriptase domain-containing protein [Tanacetum coccineum]